MHDLVIRGGLVVDGTGAPARQADIAIDNGLVIEVGDVKATGKREIDAAAVSSKPHTPPTMSPAESPVGQPACTMTVTL